jgi:hypothetical protein
MTAELVPAREREDPIREAAKRLLGVLPAREDSRVLVDFLEDDLREGFDAIADVEAHFVEVLDALRADHLTPLGLLDASEDLRVLQRLEYLLTVVSQLRRRLSQAAGRVRRCRD